MGFFVVYFSFFPLTFLCFILICFSCSVFGSCRSRSRSQISQCQKKSPRFGFLFVEIIMVKALSIVTFFCFVTMLFTSRAVLRELVKNGCVVKFVTKLLPTGVFLRQCSGQSLAWRAIVFTPTTGSDVEPAWHAVIIAYRYLRICYIPSSRAHVLRPSIRTIEQNTTTTTRRTRTTTAQHGRRG